MKIALFCKCGAGAEGNISSLKAAEKFRHVWYQLHDGPGHGDCKRDEAKRAFQKKEESSSKQMDDIDIMEKTFQNVGSPPSADAYCRCAILEAIRLTRNDAFLGATGGDHPGTTPEDRLWIEAARQVVNRMASFDEEKRKDFMSLLQDMNAEVGFRNMEEVREIKRTMVEFLAPQTLGGLRDLKRGDPL